METTVAEQIPFTTIVDSVANRTYTFVSHIGTGAFGDVYKVFDDQEKKEYALKRLGNINIRTTMETAIHCVAKHPNIVKAYNSFVVENVVYLKMELCSNKTLSDVIKEGTLELDENENEVKKYMFQLLSALRYLHIDLQVVHRDIKPANLLLDSDMNLKVADFGWSTFIPVDTAENAKKTYCGTEAYMSPEMFYSQGHGFKTDLWSAGILMFYMLKGSYPYPLRNHPTFEEEPNAMNLFRQLTTVIPSDRPSAAKALTHSFFDGFTPADITENPVTPATMTENPVTPATMTENPAAMKRSGEFNEPSTSKRFHKG